MVLCVCVSLTLAGTAAAATRSLQHDPRLDAVASDVAGFPVTVNGEDDPAAWQTTLVTRGDDPRADAFTNIAQPVIYLGPYDWTALAAIETAGLTHDDYGPNVEASAILALIHEATHQRLQSLDEGRVNACALAMFPDVIVRDFDIAPTVTQAQVRTVKHAQRVKVRQRVKVHGRFVYRTRYVTRTITTHVTTTATVANPDYTALVTEAQIVYGEQPPPYSTGTCS